MDKGEAIRVLWISTEDSLPDRARQAADSCGFCWECVAGVPEALEYIKRSPIHAVLAGFPIPEWTAAELLEAIQTVDSRMPVIIHDPQAVLAGAVRLGKLGAFDVIGNADCSWEDLIPAAIAERRNRMPAPDDAEGPWRAILVGSSRPFLDVVRMIRLVGSRRSTVLLTGETGTGKEMVARAIHLAGPRGRLPMVSVCCSALPENLLEAELFGHVRGAFTGAINQRVGRFEQAHGSTLFLDEIGDMPLELQAKLLRVLQEREFQRLGSSETVRVDVRVVAATNADLLDKVRQGRFREDLYYRLNVVPIALPPLRERSADVCELAQHFVQKICRLENLPLKEICGEALSRLARYAWPGNVRELENSVERAVVLSGDRTTLYPADFPLVGGTRPCTVAHNAPFIHLPDDGLDFEHTVGQIARSILEQALRKTKGNKQLAADMLHLKRTTLAAKLRSLESDEPDSPALTEDYVHSA